MKSCVYLDDPKVVAYLKTVSGDMGVKMDQADNHFGLKHDALARAMYKAHVKNPADGSSPSLSVDEVNMLHEAAAAGQIPASYASVHR